MFHFHASLVSDLVLCFSYESKMFIYVPFHLLVFQFVYSYHEKIYCRMVAAETEALIVHHVQYHFVLKELAPARYVAVSGMAAALHGISVTLGPSAGNSYHASCSSVLLLHRQKKCFLG